MDSVLNLGEFGWQLWCLAAIGVFLTGVSKSGFAGGTGVIAVPLMSIVMDPKIAAGLLLPLLLFMDALNVRAYWGGQSRAVFKPLVMGALVGILLGGILFHWIDALWLKLIIGLLSVLFAGYQWWMREPKLKQRQLPKGLSQAVGAVSGFTSFIAHAGGSPLTLYFLQLGLEKRTFLATSAIVIAVMNLVKLPAYALVGALNLNVGVFSLALMPLAWLGIHTGLWLKDKMSEKVFVAFMTWSLLGLGCYLVYDATQAMGLFLS